MSPVEAVAEARFADLERRLAAEFAAAKVDFVPDPMVIRAAELFILGQSGRQVALPNSEPDQVWSIIDRNLDGVLAFFHLLLTRERIPLIDYQATFMDHGIGSMLDDLAAYIHPTPADYQLVADEAVDHVDRFELDAIDPRLLSDISDELGLAGYEWFPREAQYEHLPAGQRVAATFATGGIIFGAYAQAAGADHILQTKRARLFAQLSVAHEDPALWGFDREAELFARLDGAAVRDETMAVATVSLPPTVLPMLMSGPRPPTSPAALFEQARDIRDTDIGRSYRRWHAESRSAWARGDQPEGAAAAIDDVVEELRNRYGRIHAGDVAMSLEARAQGGPSRLRNWFVDRLRFQGHRKLLLRMSLPQMTFAELTGRLKHIWETS